MAYVWATNPTVTTMTFGDLFLFIFYVAFVLSLVCRVLLLAAFEEKKDLLEFSHFVVLEY